ncbi:MAG: NADP-dependent oxidoreductase [Pseudomonadota bacterium]
MIAATQIRLKKRSEGLPQDDVWETTHDAPRALEDGEIAVEVEYVSVDPAMRGWMIDTPSYIPPVALGEVMRAGGVGRVTASKSDKFAVGDAVVGTVGVQSHYVGPADGFNEIMPELAPAPKFLGGLGMPGMTAYFGLLEIGRPKEGETIVVSGAGGAVGSVVGQIAKIKGCRVVGIAGGREKCDAVASDYGFDACIDYKNEDVGKALKSACPDGIDVYFDNVGGDTLDAALVNMAMGGRIALCGAISQYNNMGSGGMLGPRNYMQLLVKRARMEGFVVFDYAPRFPEAIMTMMGWIGEGKLTLDEHIVEGIESFPEALRMLFDGRNKGKLVVKVK